MHKPLNIVANTRDRITGVEQRLDTFMHMQYPTSSLNSEAV